MIRQVRFSVRERKLLSQLLKAKDTWNHAQRLEGESLLWTTLVKKLKSIRPWAVGQNYFGSWQPPGEWIFCGSMHSTIDARLPQKVPKLKTCQTPRKWVISDYPLLNCITARKCKILYSITTKMTCIIRKLTKNRI